MKWQYEIFINFSLQLIIGRQSKFANKIKMDQSRPTMSQSPLRMHSVQNSGSQNNFSQKQLGTLPNQGGQANARGSNYGASPIRESLIKNTGAFILGNAAGNAGN